MTNQYLILVLNFSSFNQSLHSGLRTWNIMKNAEANLEYVDTLVLSDCRLYSRASRVINWPLICVIGCGCPASIGTWPLPHVKTTYKAFWPLQNMWLLNSTSPDFVTPCIKEFIVRSLMGLALVQWLVWSSMRKPIWWEDIHKASIISFNFK